VYALRSEEGELTVGLCSATKSLAKAQADLDFARTMVHGADRTRLYGRVVRSARSHLQEGWNPEPLAGATVTVEGPAQQRFQAVTDAQGGFSLAGSLEGDYIVRATLADGSAIAPRRVTVPAGQCSGVELDAGVLASLAGRVVDPQGRPVSFMRLTLRAEGSEKSEDAYTDREGRFQLEHVPPGSYVLSLLPAHGPAVQLAESIVLGAAEAEELPDLITSSADQRR
jgi:hypothetical protein